MVLLAVRSANPGSAASPRQVPPGKAMVSPLAAVNSTVPSEPMGNATWTPSVGIARKTTTSGKKNVS